MTVLRSAFFHTLFTLNALIWFIAFLWALAMPRSWLRAIAKAWTGSCLLIHRLTTGSTVEYRGLEHIPQEGVLVAAKHQSSWETLALVTLFPDPTFILKRELLSVPFFGWYVRKSEFIAIDRSKGSEALPAMLRVAQQQLREGRQVLIFPEGTRRPVDAPPSYRAGIIKLYESLGVPCVLVAHNAGLSWPRGTFLQHKARIIIEILPAIPAGLPGDKFFERMQSEIEATTNRLVAEARGRPPGRGRISG